MTARFLTSGSSGALVKDLVAEKQLKAVISSVLDDDIRALSNHNM